MRLGNGVCVVAASEGCGVLVAIFGVTGGLLKALAAAALRVGIWGRAPLGFGDLSGGIVTLTFLDIDVARRAI